MKSNRAVNKQNLNKEFEKAPILSVSLPDPQVAAKPARRSFTAEYKRQIIKEADACQKPGELGALLRREGLYNSSLHAFRKQLETSRLKGESRSNKLESLHNENQRLKRRSLAMEREMEKMKVVIDLQKKVSELLNLTLPDLPSEYK